MHSNIYIFMLLYLISASSYSSENVYFSCETDKGDVKLFVDENILNYEFSKGDKTELSYHSLGDGFSGFSHNYYYRYQTEYGKVSFSKGKYKYSIFSHYEGNEEMSGVIVTISEKEYNIPCRKKIINKLVDLIPLLQCDKEDALGCYPER
ncbi:hypothetical protein OB934_10050 [Aeromonas salmonicida]|uniref:hypothetical protein n=1 Tax=Aeromonas TaxID=642 RepID=UPI0023DDCEE5|nr:MULTISPECIES: hypothetical protein [Aeromonas]MDF2402799.1 hypothetical protein [Aeromonas sp. 5HA1]MDM5063135.1 hypothetical protein [Aeromonas salmonicida]